METEQSEKNDAIAGYVTSGNNERDILDCNDGCEKSGTHSTVATLMSQLQNIWTPPLGDRRMRNPSNIFARSTSSEVTQYSGDGEIRKAFDTEPPLPAIRRSLQRSTVPYCNRIPARPLQPPPPYTPRHVGFQLRTLRAPTLPESNVGPKTISPNTVFQESNLKNMISQRYPTFLEPMVSTNIISLNRANQRSDSVQMAGAQRHPKFFEANVDPNTKSPNTLNQHSNLINWPEVQRYPRFLEPNIDPKSASPNTIYQHLNSMNMLGYQKYLTFLEQNFDPNIETQNTINQSSNLIKIPGSQMHPTFLISSVEPNTTSLNVLNQYSNSMNILEGRSHLTSLEPKIDPNTASPNELNQRSNSMNEPGGQRHSTFLEPNIGSSLPLSNTIERSNSISVSGGQKQLTLHEPNIDTNTESPDTLQLSNSMNISRGQRRPTFYEPKIGPNTASPNSLNQRTNSINKPGDQRHPINIGTNIASSNTLQRLKRKYKAKDQKHPTLSEVNIDPNAALKITPGPFSNSINMAGGQRHPTFLEPNIGTNITSPNTLQRSKRKNKPTDQKHPILSEGNIDPNAASKITANSFSDLKNMTGGQKHPKFLEPNIGLNTISTNTLYPRLNAINMLGHQRHSRIFEPNVDPNIASPNTIVQCLNAMNTPGDQTHTTYLETNVQRHTKEQNSCNHRSNAIEMSDGIFREPKTIQLNTTIQQSNQNNIPVDGKYPSQMKPKTKMYETYKKQLNSINMPVSEIYPTFLKANTKATSQNSFDQRPNLMDISPIQRYPTFLESDVKSNTTQQRIFDQQLNSINISTSQNPSTHQLKDPHLSNYTHSHRREIKNPVPNSPFPTRRRRKTKPRKLKSRNYDTQSQSERILQNGRQMLETPSHGLEIKVPVRNQPPIDRVEKQSEPTNPNENTNIQDLLKLNKQNYRDVSKTETVTSNAGHILKTYHLVTNQNSKSLYDSGNNQKHRKPQENPPLKLRIKITSRPTTEKNLNENTNIRDTLKITEETIPETPVIEYVTSNATGTLETQNLLTDQNRQFSTSFFKKSYESEINPQQTESDKISSPVFGIEEMTRATTSENAKKNTNTRSNTKKSKKKKRTATKMTSNKLRILKNIYMLGSKNRQHSTNLSKNSNISENIQRQHEPNRILPPIHRTKKISRHTETKTSKNPNENINTRRHSKRINRNTQGESKTETVTSNVQSSAGSSQNLHDSEINRQPHLPDKIPLPSPRIKKRGRPTKQVSTDQNIQFSTDFPKNVYDSEIYQDQVNPVGNSPPTSQIERIFTPTTTKISIENTNFQEYRKVTEPNIRGVSETKSDTSNASDKLKIYDLLTNRHHRPSSAKNLYESEKDQQQNVVVENHEGNMNKGSETDEMSTLIFSNVATIPENIDSELPTAPIPQITVSIQPEKKEEESLPFTTRGTDVETRDRKTDFNTIALLETKLRFQLVLAIPQNPPEEGDVPSLENVIDVLKKNLHDKKELTLEDVLKIYYRDEDFCDELVNITTKLLCEAE